MTTDRTQPATKPSAIALRDVTVDGARLHYAEAGTGDPLVLLHGWPETHLAWEHQIAPLSRLRRVIAPDWFGSGESTRAPGWTCDYDSEVDRIARMLDALGLDRIDFACHDYGGFLGLGFVQRHPDRVRRFALLNSRAQSTFTPAFYLLFGLFTVAARHRLLRPLLTTPPIYYVHRLGLAGFLRDGTFDAERLDHYLAMLRTPQGRRDYAHFWAGYEVKDRPELAIRLAEITCPTTIIWGTREYAIPLSTAERLARDIDDAELVRIDAGHFLMEQRPDEVTDALRRWLQRPAP